VESVKIVFIDFLQLFHHSEFEICDAYFYRTVLQMNWGIKLRNG